MKMEQLGRELSFGQRAGGIIQFAYTTADLDSGMLEFTQRLGVGPWFVIGPFSPPEGKYRGEPTDIQLSLAIGFAGHMMVELVQQHDDKPSVYQETIKSTGYGFHHWAIASLDFELDVERYRRMGYEVVFSDRSPRGARIVYMDTSRHLPGLLEIIELIPALEKKYTEMYEASLAFDGSNPIRR